MRITRTLLLLLASMFLLGASECGLPANCTQCGFQANEHIMTSYLDGQGASIPISGYADANGCFRPFECPGP